MEILRSRAVPVAKGRGEERTRTGEVPHPTSANKHIQDIKENPSNGSK